MIEKTGYTVNTYNKEYEIEMPRPGACICGGRAVKNGQSRKRTIMDVLDGELVSIPVSYTRYRCNKCHKPLGKLDRSEILNGNSPWTEEALIYLIRLRLEYPELSYAKIESKYKVAKGSLFKAFQVFRQKIKLVAHPSWIQHTWILCAQSYKLERNVCVFGADKTGQNVGLLEILPEDELIDFLAWLYDKPTHKEIVCDEHIQAIEKVLEYYPGASCTINTLKKMEKALIDELGELIIRRIQAIDRDADDYDDQVEQICNWASQRYGGNANMDGSIFALQEYADCLRKQVPYDAEYVDKTIQLILSMRARGCSYDEITLYLMFSSKLLHNQFVGTELEKYLV